MDHVARIVAVEKIDPLGSYGGVSHQNPSSRRKGDRPFVRLVIA
jgi:hypothetical protein